MNDRVGCHGGESVAGNVAGRRQPGEQPPGAKPVLGRARVRTRETELLEVANEINDLVAHAVFAIAAAARDLETETWSNGEASAVAHEINGEATRAFGLTRLLHTALADELRGTERHTNPIVLSPDQGPGSHGATP